MIDEIKVSSCCGYPLVLVNGGESTSHYNCNKCGWPCDGVSDCADCFPQNFTHKGNNQTVPICDKHFRVADHTTRSTFSPEAAKSITSECHCSKTSRYHTQDSNYDLHTPEKCIKNIRNNDDYATLIGGIILNVGNLYNENKQDITVRVAEYIYKNYLKQ